MPTLSVMGASDATQVAPTMVPVVPLPVRSKIVWPRDSSRGR